MKWGVSPGAHLKKTDSPPLTFPKSGRDQAQEGGLECGNVWESERPFALRAREPAGALDEDAANQRPG